MNEQRQKRSLDTSATSPSRPASGERPAARAVPATPPRATPRPGPPPPPNRVSPPRVESPRPGAAPIEPPRAPAALIEPPRAPVESPPPNRKEAPISAKVLNEPEAAAPDSRFCAEESPTVSFSKPILKLLVQETAPLDPQLSITLPDPTPEPEPEAAVIVQIAPEDRAPTSQKNCDTVPPARPRQRLVAAKAKPSRSDARLLVWVSAFLLGGAAIGASSWFATRRVESPAPRVAPPTAAVRADVRNADPAPMKLADPVSTKAANPTPIEPARAAAQAKDALSAGDRGYESAVAPASTLLASDGSEATAPTCDALLRGVPAGAGERTTSARISEARRALVRGDVDASQGAFCHVVSAGAADATVLSEFAQLLLLRRDGKAAAEWAKQAARVEPSSRNLGLLGDALIRAGDLEGARDAWLASAKIAKGDAAAIGKMLNSTLADARASLQHRDAARADRLLRRVLAFDPQNATARTEIAVALTRLGFRKSAELWSQHTVASSQRQ